jgi:hypothetical protein
MTETAKLPMTGSAGRPLKMAEYLAEAERLRETVDAYRRAGGSGAVACKLERRRATASAATHGNRGLPTQFHAAHGNPGLRDNDAGDGDQMATAEIRGASPDQAGR